MDFGDFLSLLCSFSSILLYMTGWPVVYHVLKRKSIGDMSTFPYIAMLINCTTWLIYGMIVNNKVLKGVNSVGSIHQVTFIFIFYAYCKNRRIFTRQILGAVFCLGLVMSYVHKELDRDQKSVVKNLGLLGTSLGIVAYMAPLSAMGEVISKKSTSSMNFTLSLANFIVAIEWSLYGNYIDDIFVLLPNLLGIVVSAAQLGLFWIYGITSNSPPVLPTTSGQSAKASQY